jgi:hydrogenase expression/formation protein HypC
MCLGIPGKLTEIYGSEGLQMGMVDFGGVRREVCLAYVAGEVEAGDYVIVHVGFAISKVDEEEARRTFELLEEISELDELEWMKEVAEQSLSGMGQAQEPPPAGPGGGPVQDRS